MNHNPIEAAYGLTHMSLEQEIAAPEPVKQTRRGKIRIIDDCAAIQRWIDANGGRAQRIPELNDADHAKLVQGLADKIHAARIALEMAWNGGGK